MNNPFASTPESVVQSTANRFPSVDVPQAQPDPYQQQQQQYNQQQQMYQQPQQPQQQPQLQSQNSYNQPQFQSNPNSQIHSGGFIPQTGFGQQLSAQVTGYQSGSGTGSSFNGGYSPGLTGGGGASPFQSGNQSAYSQQLQPPQQQQPQQYSNTSNYQSNLPQSQPHNFLDLDPYASQQQQPSQIPSSFGTNPSQSQPLPPTTIEQKVSHPRQFVQQEKALLMAWNVDAWKHLLSRLDSLREAWEARKEAIRDLGSRGGDPTQIDHLSREAESNVDSIHASKFQLAEVQAGWKFSTDPSSKARVREALNAGLSSLPEYPPPLSGEQIGGAFYRTAQEDYRKQNIMSGFGQQQQPQQYQQQQQQAPQMQQQYTGYPGQQQPQQMNPYQQAPFQSNQSTGFFQPGNQQQRY